MPPNKLSRCPSAAAKQAPLIRPNRLATALRGDSPTRPFGSLPITLKYLGKGGEKRRKKSAQADVGRAVSGKVGAVEMVSPSTSTHTSYCQHRAPQKLSCSPPPPPRRRPFPSPRCLRTQNNKTTGVEPRPPRTSRYPACHRRPDRAPAATFTQLRIPPSICLGVRVRVRCDENRDGSQVTMFMCVCVCVGEVWAVWVVWVWAVWAVFEKKGKRIEREEEIIREGEKGTCAEV